MGLYIPLYCSLLTIISSLIIFFQVSLFQKFSLVLLSLVWIPLSSMFVTSYPKVDSLGGEVYILFSNLLGGFP